MAHTLKMFSEPKVDPSKFNRSFFVYTYSEEKASFVMTDDIRLIRFENGKYYINGTRILKVQFGPRSVSWKQQTMENFTAGQLNMSSDGLELTGTIALGKNSKHYTLHHILATFARPSPYSTMITKKRWPEGTDPAGIPDEEWQEGLELQLGYHYNVGQPIPSTMVKLDKHPISDYVSLSIAKGDLLRLELTLDETVVCNFDDSLYLESEIVFSTFGEDFVGTIRSTCQDKSQEGVFLWTGKVINPDIPLLTTVPEESDEDMLFESEDLSVAELLSLVPDENVHKVAYDMLVENMKWAIAQNPQEKDWLTNFFSQYPPVLTPQRISLIENDIDWYQQKFAKAYLGWGLNSLTGKAAPVDKLDKEQTEILKYFLKEGLAKSGAYNSQMKGLFIEAYLSSKPRLKSFINDGADKWAITLFETITSESQITLAVNRILADNDPSPVNNLSALLMVLDSTGNYAKKYQETILASVILKSAFQTMVKDENVTMSWMTDVLEEFVNQYGSENTNKETKFELDSDFSNNKKAFADSVRETAQEFGGYDVLAKSFTSLLVEAKGTSIIEQSISAYDAFEKKYPKHALCGQVILFVNMVGGVTNVSSSLLGWWYDMPIEKKIKMINTGVSTIGKLADYCAEILRVEITLDGWNKINKWLSQSDILDDTIALMNSVEDDWVMISARSTSELFDMESRTIQTQSTKWEKIFDTGAKFLKVLGLVTSVVSTVISTIKLFDDFKEGKAVSTKVFDGILMATNGLTAICIVLDLTFSLEVFALASSIFAAAGLVVVIIVMFLPTPKEELPVNVFMTKTAIPFVNSLPKPKASDCVLPFGTIEYNLN